MIQVIKREIKKLKEAILDFDRGGRSDLSEKNKKEIQLMEKYLPPELPLEDLEKMIIAKIAELGIQGVNQFGRLMGAVMKEAAGQADGNAVKEAVTRILNNKFKKE